MRRYGDAPYQADHATSVARKAQPPKDLVGWFLEAFRSETPTAMNGHSVFVGQPDKPGKETLWARETKTADLSGGSLLGSPGDVADFRRFIEDGPRQVERAEYEGSQDHNVHYRYPLRAALAELGGRGKVTDEYPFMARVLYRTAMRDGDWDGACESMGIIGPVRRVYVEEALRRLWRHYVVEPPARTIRTTKAA